MIEVIEVIEVIKVIKVIKVIEVKIIFSNEKIISPFQMSMLQKMSELEINEIDLFPARHHPDYIISSIGEAKSIKNVNQEKKFIETSKKTKK